MRRLLSMRAKLHYGMPLTTITTLSRWRYFSIKCAFDARLNDSWRYNCNDIEIHILWFYNGKKLRQRRTGRDSPV